MLADEPPLRAEMKQSSEGCGQREAGEANGRGPGVDGRAIETVEEGGLWWQCFQLFAMVQEVKVKVAVVTFENLYCERYCFKFCRCKK
jgi:hypothetical protein